MTTSPVSTGVYVAQNERVPSKTMDQEDFIRLLITQMTHQDPTKPQDTGAMMEQMTAMSNLQAMNQMLTNSQVTLAQSLLGKTVSVNDSDNNLVTGVVSEMKVQNGTTYMVIDGVNYDLSDLYSVLPSTTSTTP
ncbi:MAG: flagellar hook capping FlgD N-terminal domain-containing protein [Verrucomicrobiae bacterium]|nr:flagellar hook capping FlgD N-terminal domain-containing protein [Verrucomicrobiae bacterium]